jgi:hypothetical protein
MPLDSEDSPRHQSTQYSRTDSVTRSRRAVLLSALASGALAGCLSGSGGDQPTTTPTPYPTDTPTPSLAEQNPDRALRPEFDTEPPRLDPAYPETQSEIAAARETIVSQYYEQIGNPRTDEPTRVSSLQELNDALGQDDVHVKMEPGNYHITLDNYTDVLSQFNAVRKNADPNVGGDTWPDPVNLLNFAGNRSYYDLRDVTITYETRLLNAHAEPLGLDPGATGLEVMLVTGDQSIVRGLNLQPVHKPEEWDEPTYPSRSARTLNLWGPRRTMLQDVSVRSKGSKPYGYGRILGKGGNALTGLNKHSAVAWGGKDNCIVGCEVQSGSYGHGQMVSPYRFVFIDHTVSGELRRSDDMLEETDGPLAELDYETKYGTLEPGVMISLQEGGMRTYNVVQEESKLLNVTIEKFDGAMGLANSKVGWFFSHCSTLKNAGLGLSPPQKSNALNCEADVRYGPALALGGKYAADGDPTDVEVDLEILPSPTTGIEQQYHGFTRMSDRKYQGAYIAGDGHDITLRQTADDLQLDAPRPLLLGSWGLSAGGATNVTLENRTDLPVILLESTRNCAVRTDTAVENRGSNNTVERL